MGHKDTVYKDGTALIAKPGYSEDIFSKAWFYAVSRFGSPHARDSHF